MPVLASLLFGLACAFLIATSALEVYQVTPFSEGTFGFFGSFGNALYFAVLAGVGAGLIYLLLKRSKQKLITVITGFALTIAVFMLSMVYMYAALSGFLIPYVDVLVLIVSVLITAVSDYAVFRSKYVNVVVLAIGGALGTFLGFSIPTISAILVLSVLAIYDVFAVYRGPVGKMAQNGLDRLRGLSFSFRDVQMGLGDLTFYSMLSGRMFLAFGLLSCLASMVGILVGCIISFKIVERKGVFPGLPFPVFLGLATGFTVLLL
jgi:presenilin-like A22 family membrane protease